MKNNIGYLSPTERLILINQYEIIKALIVIKDQVLNNNSTNSKNAIEYLEIKECDKNIQILSNGFEGYYADLTLSTDFSYNPLSEEECNQIHQILDMYKDLLKHTMDKNKCKFNGFDKNQEYKYANYIDFLLQQSLYPNVLHKDMSTFTIGYQMPKYLQMLEKWCSIKSKKENHFNYTLTEQEIDEILEIE